MPNLIQSKQEKITLNIHLKKIQETTDNRVQQIISELIYV